MVVHCSKDILLENANIVSKAVSGRTTLPILECVLLSAEDGSFRMTANDLELAIETAPIESEIIEAGSVALEAKMFFEIVRRMPEGQISIASDTNNTTVIRCQKSEFKILGLNALEFPVLAQVERNDMRNINAALLKSMIKKTIFAVSVDETKPILTGELLEVKDGWLNIVAVDGFRVSYCRVKTDINNMKLVIPARTMNELARILPAGEDDSLFVCFTEKHAVLETPCYTVVTRLLDGDFITYEPLFDGEFSTVVTVRRVTLLSGLERASLIASKEVRKNPVLIKIKDSTLTVSSQTETGAVTDVISVEVEGNDIDIGFNPRFIMDVLKNIDDDAVTMSFTTPLSPCVIRGMEDANAKFLVLPLRLSS